jgi:hypothetical protein
MGTKRPEGKTSGDKTVFWHNFNVHIKNSEQTSFGCFFLADVMSPGHFIPPDILSLRLFCPSVCFVPGRYVSGRFVWLSYTSTPTYIYRRRPPIYIYSTHLCCSGRFIHYRYWIFHDDLGYRVVPTKFGLFV